MRSSSRPPGGRVNVSGEVDESALCIRIKDTGIGIRAQDIPLVVQPFYRVNSVLDAKHQGAGLGLPFAKSVVELHGGTLDIRKRTRLGNDCNRHSPLGARLGRCDRRCCVIASGDGDERGRSIRLMIQPTIAIAAETIKSASKPAIAMAYTADHRTERNPKKESAVVPSQDGRAAGRKLVGKSDLLSWKEKLRHCG